MSTKKSGIYRITNQANNKIYIGSAYNLSNRFSTHKYSLKNNKHKNPHLQNAWNLYGEQQFIFEILEIVEDKTKILEREQYYLDFYNPYDNKIGYNIAKKAENTAGIKASSETRKKQSESAKKRKHYKWTEEQKKRRSEQQKGKIKSWAKLNWSIVNDIRKLYNEGLFQKNIAEKFNLAQTTISEIIRNVIWQDDNYTYNRRRNG
jgi:predicted GIY-YIG superfamily endonuclease